ncbi:MAG: phospholipase D-like domain-containing protein, partial [Verrucomicrobiota bacterium]
LAKGCRIHLMPPPFEHTKLMVVDGIWSLIGSTNLDPRSLRLNFEYNLECCCPELAVQLERIVADKMQGTRELTLEELAGQNFFVRMRNGLTRLLTPYL